MRSFSPLLRTATLTAFLIGIPLTGAYAASHNRGVLDPTTPSDLTGQRVEALIEQAQGVRQGIVDARQANSITPAVAEHLEMRTNQISRTAEKIAASDHGRIPAELALPIDMCQDANVVSAGQELFGQEPASEDWAHAERRQPFRRNQRDVGRV